MNRSTSPTAALLAAALAACGGERDGTARAEGAPDGAGPVYTSEVEQVSRWVREGGGAVDAAGLEAAPNPGGEGVIVRSRTADSAGGEPAAWAVVDSQVVPLNPASRRAAPARPDSAGAPTPSPVEPPPAVRRRPPAEPRPRVPAPDTTAPVPFPRPDPEGPPDTLHLPGGPPDTVHVPARPRALPDTVRIP